MKERDLSKKTLSIIIPDQSAKT